MTSGTQPLRVLQVIGAMDRGGAETLVMNLYRNIDRNIIQFDFLVNEARECDYDSEIKDLGGHLYRIPRFNILNYPIYKSTTEKFFSSHSYSVVHGHIGLPAAIYLKDAKKNGSYVIAHSHRMNFPLNPPEIAFRVCSRPVRHVADYFMACSEQAGIDRFGSEVTQGPNFKVLKNGIDLNKGRFDPVSRFEIRNELGIPFNASVFGHVGRLTEVKNHRFLLQIFKEIHNEIPDAQLLLLGRGELEGYLKKLAHELEIADVVKFLGVKDDVPRYLSAMDGFIFPSLSEGLPFAVIEAQASGLPCIVSSGISETAKVRTQTKFLDLSLGPNYWAKEAMKAIKDSDESERAKAYLDVQFAGFDIKESADWLSEFYLMHANR